MLGIYGRRIVLRKLHISLLVLSAVVLSLLLGCGAQEAGTLQFHANGEDFVRQGFVSKDGWSISFDHVFINLAEIAGYQTDPPYDPHDGGPLDVHEEVGLDGTYLVDLAEGGPDAAPILVGQVLDAPAGQYNAVSWRMDKGADGPAAGYSLVMVGTGEKEGQQVDFIIQVESEYEYTCGEYVGDQRKGILQEGGTADLEMTFHFDHIFGDAETPLDDALNVGAPGFEPFAAVAGGAGMLQADMGELQEAMAPADFQKLIDILPTLGHVGEGHCHSEMTWGEEL
jgi:hypothetical protein